VIGHAGKTGFVEVATGSMSVPEFIEEFRGKAGVEGVQPTNVGQRYRTFTVPWRTYAEHGASKTSFRTFVRLGKRLLTRGFRRWAVTGSNRRPLRCKGGSAEFVYQRRRSFSQFRCGFRIVSLSLS
jgi:hypothetical protein